MSRIKDARLAAGMTQEELAAAVGVKQPSVAQWENGSTYPRVPMLRALAEVLHTTVDALIEEVETDDKTADAR